MAYRVVKTLFTQSKCLTIHDSKNTQNLFKKVVSFNTSVSDTYSFKATNKTIGHTRDSMNTFFKTTNREPTTTKLYISCVNHCPYLGQLSNEYISNQILFYHSEFPFDEICISDTSGELSYSDFRKIIEKCIFNNIPLSKFSIRIQKSGKSRENTEKIVQYCLSNNIYRFVFYESDEKSIEMSDAVFREILTESNKMGTFTKTLEYFVT